MIFLLFFKKKKTLYKPKLKMIKITKNRILLTLVTIFSLWAGSGFFIYNFWSTPEERGTVGDMFGTVNALFSGLALFGIIITILIQQKELTLQRQELSETRLEFQITRVTNIIYNQLKRMEEKVEKCFFFNPTIVDIGSDRGFELINQYYFIPSLANEKDDGFQLWQETKQKVYFDNILLRNEKELDNVLGVLSDSCRIIKSLIENKSIPSEIKEELKLIFFRNIESELMNLVKNMNHFVSTINETASSTNILSNNVLENLKKNLKLITEFKDLKF